MLRFPAVALLLAVLAGPARAADSLTSGDAFVRYDPSTLSWTCGTGLIEQRLELAGGRFLLAHLTNRLTGTEYVAGQSSDEFRFLFGGVEFTGASGGYSLKSYRIEPLPIPTASIGIEPGVTLTLELEHPLFALCLHYDIYASTPRTQLGMIRKWYTVTNRTGGTQPLTQISMNRLRLRPEGSMRFTLYSWLGGGAGKNCNALQTEHFAETDGRAFGTKARTFFSMSGNPDYRADDIFSGTASWHPYFVLEDSKAGEGFFFGFNYLGPWSARIWNPGNNEVGGGFPVQSQLELHTEPLAPGAAFEVPNGFIGVYKGDLDNACEQLQDWQATFKWDYTRERYLFLASIYNRYWCDRNYMQKPDLHWKVMWDIAERCRRTGVEIAHEDDFWFDLRGRGVWEGPEWGELVRYLSQSGGVFKLWICPQHFAPGTPQDLEHPDWALDPKVPDGITIWYGRGFCVASQPAHDYMRNFMLEREKRYGTFFWRMDGWVEAPCASTGHDHPAGQPFVQQYRHFLGLLREVKDANPELALEGCNSGGEWVNWDKFEMLEDNQGSDGDGPDERYYLSYFWPVAKMIWGSGEGTEDEAQARAESAFRHFLRREGVYDRYMKVFHPRAEGAPTPHTYLQLTNGTRTKAIITQDSVPDGAVVVYPRALVPEAEYSVTFRYGKGVHKATGAELMQSGISLEKPRPDEIVLLNLDSAPGRSTDTTPPSAPTGLSRKKETWNGRTGVALRWNASRDDGIVSHYEIHRGGKLLDYVALGTFYFDPETAGGQNYSVVAVDGDGNRSKPARIK